MFRRLMTLGLVSGVLAVGAQMPALCSATITVNANARGGSLVKPGLGDLFAAATLGGGTPAALMSGALVGLTTSQEAIGNTTNPFGTANVAPIVRAAGGKMICRFNDMIPGFPYQWISYANWIQQVTAATKDVSANYKDVVYAIAPFNEPDNSEQGAFMTDPAIQGTTYNQRFNWLWTQTVNTIRSIDPTIPIMGPNYEFFTPQYNSTDLPKMTAFLQNAIATNTVPNIIGFHSLGANPDDAANSLNTYYRPLENQLNVPGRPLKCCIEEYGPNTGDFEGVPGSMVKFWASYARGGIDFACMGIYEYGSVLGNSIRYPWNITGYPQPDGGWYMMNWYKQMQGQYIPVIGGASNYYQGPDAVSSWDPNAKVLTVVAGGADDDVNVQVNGVGGLGIGTSVRVRLDETVWDKDPNEADKVVEHGGDPKTGTYNLYDKIMNLDGNGNIAIPITRMEGYNGYRILISASAGPDSYPTKYEAENGVLTDVTVHAGSDGVLASNGSYVGGINNSDSSVKFNVNVPMKAIYVMTVRYANGTTSAPATHTCTVNGVSQGSVTYPYTTVGWSPTEMRTTTKRVALNAGANTITLGKGTGYAEIDYIDVRPDTHRYEAENATVTDATKYQFASMINAAGSPTFVGGINNTDSGVTFAIDTPANATYNLVVSYGNGTTSNSVFNISVNGASAGSVTLPPTGGWLSNANPQSTERFVTVPITLNTGVNQVKLLKGTGYAELDNVQLFYGAALGNGTFQLSPVGVPGSDLDALGGGTAWGTGLDEWQITGGSNQKWVLTNLSSNIYKIQPSYDLSLAVNDPNGSTTPGTALNLWQDNGTTSEQWAITQNSDSTFSLVPECATGLDLDLWQGNATNGTIIDGWTANGLTPQRWILH